jgi:hypothetical protein
MPASFSSKSFCLPVCFPTNNYEMRRIIRSVVVSCGCETKSLILRKEHMSIILTGLRSTRTLLAIILI